MLWASPFLRSIAFERGKQTFSSASPDTTTLLVDENGAEWQRTETTLIRNSGQEPARLPGHMAYRFGRFSFYPQTEVYGVEQ